MKTCPQAAPRNAPGTATTNLCDQILFRMLFSFGFRVAEALAVGAKALTSRVGNP